jgi:quinol monooxygenase YgiN
MPKHLSHRRAGLPEQAPTALERARAFDGCIHVAITADSVDPERIDSVEVWRDADVMAKWREQAETPDVVEAKYAEVKRFDATDGGPLF